MRRGFGVLFSDGGLFSSMTVFENVAFPLREHTRRSEREIAATVRQKLDMVGALGAERMMPADLPAGTRKRAALARAMVLDPQIVLIDEPEAGLDPVRSAHLHQLIVDLNQHTGITFLLASHDIQAVRTVPDNIGLLYGGKLAMFGPREMLLSSHDPVIRQFLTATRAARSGSPSTVWPTGKRWWHDPAAPDRSAARAQRRAPPGGTAPARRVAANARRGGSGRVVPPVGGRTRPRTRADAEPSRRAARDDRRGHR